MSNVIPLRPGDEPRRDVAVPAAAAVEELLVGEVVDEPRAAAGALPGVPAVPSPVLGPRARLAARHLGYVAAGAVVAVRRRHLKRTLDERVMRALEAQGNHEAMLAWRQQRETERKQRSEDRRKWAELIAPDRVKAALAVMACALISPGLLGACLAVDHHNPRWVPVPYEWAAHAVGLGVEAVFLVLAWGPWVAAAAVVARLHHLGRTAGDMAPRWALAGKPEEQDRGLVVTADGIVVALQNLPIPELKKAFRDKWQPAFRLTPVKDGEGYSSIFSLPMGVTPEMIADKNAIFARNLHRAKVECWPTDAERDGVAAAGFVNLWVANPGVLDRPAPEWPLLAEGAADVFKGVPAGVTARGLPVLIPIVGNNFSIGGLMGQGKSNACRVVMLGAALDPLAELLVHVFAYNGDFDCFEPRLARYVKGAEEEQIDAAMYTLTELQAEVARREQMLADLHAKKVTRALAERHPELRPRLTLFSECHELFGHKEYGEEATETATAVERRARKTALWMGFDTQDSRKDAIPPKLLSLVSIRACLPVTSWRTNDGFLWDGAFKSGVRATELRPGRDIGRSIITGVSNEQFEILKWHYIFSDDDTGADDATPVIARAMANLAPGTPVGASVPLPAIEARDLLGDLAEVTRDDSGRVNVAELPPRLRKLAPRWGAYKQLTGVQLRQLLEVEGVRVYTTGGTLRVDPADLAGRATGPTGATPAGQGHVEPLDD